MFPIIHLAIVHAVVALLIVPANPLVEVTPMQRMFQVWNDPHTVLLCLYWELFFVLAIKLLLDINLKRKAQS